MKFTKMQGIGNDYIYVNCFEEKVENPAQTAIALSDRHYGVGSDGLILICPSEVADFKMDMYNSDGSQGEMCGNGTRCIAKYVYERGLTNKKVVTLETLAGIKTLSMKVENGIVESVEVNMGSPKFEPQLIPVHAEGYSESVIKMPIEVDGKTYEITCVSMGNPHAVVFFENPDDVDKIEIEKLGPLFELNKIFPKRTNTEFASVIDKNTIKMRVWERGAGETLACGTGACAVLVAATLCGLSDGDATINLRGGKLHVRWDKNDGNVYMTGGATFVFDGEVL